MVNMKELIDNWCKNNRSNETGARSRVIAMSRLLATLKNQGFTKSDIDEEIASYILGKFTNIALPAPVKIQLQIVMVMELNMVTGIIMTSKSGFEKEEALQEEVAFNKPAKSPDVYEQEPGEITIQIDRNEIKDKEFDMNYLNHLGIDVKDLTNE